MRFEEMGSGLKDKAKGCEMAEERMAFIEENDIELTGEQLGVTTGGIRLGGELREKCPKNNGKLHQWEFTGRTHPSGYFKDIWSGHEIRCKLCGKMDWD